MTNKSHKIRQIMEHHSLLLEGDTNKDMKGKLIRLAIAVFIFIIIIVMKLIQDISVGEDILEDILIDVIGLLILCPCLGICIFNLKIVKEYEKAETLHNLDELPK